MKITPGHIVLPIVVIIVGALLVYVGFWGGWGLTWASGGLFFITIGLSAILLTLAWVLPGPIGAFLRHPMVSILILCAVVGMLCLTVVLGITSRIR